MQKKPRLISYFMNNCNLSKNGKTIQHIQTFALFIHNLLVIKIIPYYISENFDTYSETVLIFIYEAF